MALCFAEASYVRSQFYNAHAFSIFFAPVTLTLTRWPSYYMNLTGIPCRYTGWGKMNFLRQVLPKLSHYCLRMRAFSHAWSLPVTRQRWRSRHWIGRSQKSHFTCKLHGSMFYRTAVICRWKFHVAELEIFDPLRSCDLDLDKMTFIYERDPYSLEIHRMCKI